MEPIHIPNYPATHLSIYCLSTHLPSTLSSSIHLSTYLVIFTHPSTNPSFFLSVHVATYHPCMHLSIHSSIHPSSIHSCIHPSIHLCMHSSSVHPCIHPIIHPRIHPSSGHVHWALLCPGRCSGGWRHIREAAGHNPCLCGLSTLRVARKAANKGSVCMVCLREPGAVDSTHTPGSGSGWAARMVPTLKDWLALGVGWAYSSQGGNASAKALRQGHAWSVRATSRV